MRAQGHPRRESGHVRTSPPAGTRKRELPCEYPDADIVVARGDKPQRVFLRGAHADITPGAGLPGQRLSGVELHNLQRLLDRQNADDHGDHRISGHAVCAFLHRHRLLHFPRQGATREVQLLTPGHRPLSRSCCTERRTLSWKVNAASDHPCGGIRSAMSCTSRRMSFGGGFRLVLEKDLFHLHGSRSRQTPSVPR
jgi:hypothetical protein